MLFLQEMKISKIWVEEPEDVHQGVDGARLESEFHQAGDKNGP